MIPGPALIYYILLNLFEASTSAARYECGPNGKFEYCIDDHPVCTVGCSCYAGYYFDTNTKICEPSTKLFKESRRYDSEVVHRNVRPIQATSPASINSRHLIDSKVDTLTKNADELSNWLYNQFFKDVEKQVINSTDKSKRTREESSHGTWKGIKKKHSQKKKHKRDSLRRQLLKIAEDDSIFESEEEIDDNDDEDDDDEDDDESEDESDEGSREKGKTHKLKNRNQIRLIEHGDDNDKNHHHKEILMLKSEPKPTLPSFILLPNLDPFGGYPLALPPAPPIQMFPMAPVPPMMAFPPGLPFCDESSETKNQCDANQPKAPNPNPQTNQQSPGNGGTPSGNGGTPSGNGGTPSGNGGTPSGNGGTPSGNGGTAPGTGVKPPGNGDPPVNNPGPSNNSSPGNEKQPNDGQPNDNDTQPKDETKPPRLRSRIKPKPNPRPQPKPQIKPQPKPQPKIIPKIPTQVGEKSGGWPLNAANNKYARKDMLRTRPRLNIMEQLKAKQQKFRNIQNKLKQTNDKLQVLNDNYKPEIAPIVPETPKDILDDMVFLADEPYSTMYDNIAEKPSTAEPIGFKYLSELIHRPGNKPNDQHLAPLFSPHRPPAQKPSYENLIPLDVSSRRAPPAIHKPQADKFLTELGRQIASLIRKFEIKDVETTREIEQLRSASTQQPSVFNENLGNYGSRSYWERSVRSPTPKTSDYTDELDDTYLNSNERLLQLENKVHVAAKKMSLLELDQLERIANIMEMKKNMELDEIDKKEKSPPSNSSLNISLLPGLSDTKTEHPKTSSIATTEKAKIIKNTNKIQITAPKNITVSKSKLILNPSKEHKTINLFTPNRSPAKKPYKHTWDVDGVGFAEAAPAPVEQKKNHSSQNSEKVVTNDMIYNYLTNVLRKRFGNLNTHAITRRPVYQTSTRRPLLKLKPILQMHSPLKHIYRPPPQYHRTLTEKPPLLNMETEMNKPLKIGYVQNLNPLSNPSVPKTDLVVQIPNENNPIQQTSYFHHDFQDLDYYDRK